VFSDPGSQRDFVASIDLSIDQALEALRGNPVSRPITAKWKMGDSAPGDVIWTTLAIPVLVSEKIVGLLREKEITGWDARPIDLFDGAKRLLAGYYLLEVRGRCGPIEDSRSAISQKNYPRGSFPVWRGLYFDPNSWDGSDVFTPAGNVAWIFLTQQVKRVFEGARLGNVLFTAANRIERTHLDHPPT